MSALQRGVGLAFVDALELDALERGEVHRILDVGCGDGFLTEKIAERSHAHVVGIDPSAAMLTRARERNSQRLSFVELDVRTMTFDEPFDLIVSANALHWVPDLAGAFTRMFAAQAPAGRLVCQLVGASDAASIEDVAVTVTESDDWQSYFEPGFRPYIHPAQSELRHVAEAAGYRDVDTDEWTERFTFATEEHFRRWCAAGMSVWTNRLPEDRRAPFIEEVSARYTTLHAVRLEFQFAQLRLSARRPPA